MGRLNVMVIVMQRSKAQPVELVENRNVDSGLPWPFGVYFILDFLPRNEKDGQAQRDGFRYATEQGAAGGVSRKQEG